MQGPSQLGIVACTIDRNAGAAEMNTVQLELGFRS
jgi:hypothetical protein